MVPHALEKSKSMQKGKNLMKFTCDKYVLNDIAAPNPTPMSKLDKYKIETKKSGLVRSWSEIGLLLDCNFRVLRGKRKKSPASGRSGKRKNACMRKYIYIYIFTTYVHHIYIYIYVYIYVFII